MKQLFLGLVIVRVDLEDVASGLLRSRNDFGRVRVLSHVNECRIIDRIYFRSGTEQCVGVVKKRNSVVGQCLDGNIARVGDGGLRASYDPLGRFALVSNWDFKPT